MNCCDDSAKVIILLVPCNHVALQSMLSMIRLTYI